MDRQSTWQSRGPRDQPGPAGEGGGPRVGRQLDAGLGASTVGRHGGRRAFQSRAAANAGHGEVRGCGAARQRPDPVPLDARRPRGDCRQRQGLHGYGAAARCRADQGRPPGQQIVIGVIMGTEGRRPLVRSILTAVGLSLAIASTAVAQSGAPVYELNTKGVTAPAIIKEVRPVYPPDAKAEGVTGMVELQGVVESDGMIDRIKVTKSLDARLDAESIKALEQWQFKPGMKDGEAVAVRVNVEMTFMIK